MYHLDVYFCLFLTKKSEMCKIIHIFDAIFDHIPGNFFPALRITISACFCCTQDGGFLVRPSESKNNASPYSLTLWYDMKVRNLKIRRREEDGKFALGTPKEKEEVRRATNN